MKLERGRGRVNKIEEYGLVEHALTLLKITPKMTYPEIAHELNVIGNVPEDDLIKPESVASLVNGYPEIRKEVLLANRKHMRKLVLESAEFDMLGQLKEMAARTAFMMEAMEEMAIEQGSLPNPIHYKALNSEMRETLKQIEQIYKDVYDMDVVREFLIEVINTLKEVSPEALSAFIAKMKGKRENNHMVSELLKGGLK